MTEVVVAGPDDRRRWRDDWARRLDAWYRPLGFGDTVRRRQQGFDRAVETVLGVVHDRSPDRSTGGPPRPVGQVAVARVAADRPGGRAAESAFIVDLWIDPAHRGRGLGRAARAFAEQWGRERVPTFGVATWSDDPGLAALFADYPLRSQRMVKDLATPTAEQPTTQQPTAEHPTTWVGRDLSPAEYSSWVEREITGFAADLSESGSLPAADARVASEKEFAELLPQGLATPGQSMLVVEDDGRPVADIWVAHAVSPGLSFVYSVAVLPAFRGRGYGRAAMRLGEADARAAGDTRLGLNVFGSNPVAMGLYTSLGYVVVEQSRSLDPWS